MPCRVHQGLDGDTAGEVADAQTPGQPAGLLPSKKLGHFLGFLLGDTFLGFLAIVAVVLTLIPLFFKSSTRLNALLEGGQWSIILLFATEYGIGLASATSRKRFLLNPWRLIDAATILIPLVTLLPGTTRLLLSSPVLRLARLARVTALGARAAGITIREESATAASPEPAPVQVRMLPSTGGTAPRAATWEEFVQWAKQPGSQWYSVANVDQHNLAELAKATGISQDFIAAHLLGTSFPHIEVTDRYVSLFVWLPEKTLSGKIERNGLLLLASDKSILTFCRRPAHLMEKIAGAARTDLAPLSFPVRIMCQLFEAVLDANEALVGQFERDLRILEEMPVRESRQRFFEDTFRLKKNLSATQADLWRLRGVFGELNHSRIKLLGNDSAVVPLLRDLSETADYLYETVHNIRQGVLSLIELHMNVVSFEMNRVMRVLAVVSVLGLIPAVVGGLLGMNLVDNPWPFTLPQVTFAVCAGMVTCLYFFVVKGWLR